MYALFNMRELKQANSLDTKNSKNLLQELNMFTLEAVFDLTQVTQFI